MTNRHYALIGFSAPAIFWLTYFIMSGKRPDYSFTTKAISELGSLDSPNKWLWNIIGYCTTGILISIFSYGLYKNIQTEKSSKTPLIGLLLSGLFMSFSGIFPGDFENKQSLTMLLHSIGSFGSYVFFLLGAFTFPKQMGKSQYWNAAIKPGLAFTWLTILFGSWPFLFPKMPAVGQRLVFVFYFLWIIFNAYKLYNQQVSFKITNR